MSLVYIVVDVQCSCMCVYWLVEMRSCTYIRVAVVLKQQQQYRYRHSLLESLPLPLPHDTSPFAFIGRWVARSLAARRVGCRTQPLPLLGRRPFAVRSSLPPPAKSLSSAPLVLLFPDIFGSIPSSGGHLQ